MAHTTGAARASVATAMMFAGSIGLALGGCDSTGQTTLLLDGPFATELDPRRGITTIEIETTAPSESPVVQRVELPTGIISPQDLKLGDLPTGSQKTIKISGFTATGQLAAFGQSAPTDISSGSNVTLQVALRRPFAYVTSSLFSPVGTGEVTLHDLSDRLKARPNKLQLPSFFPTKIAALRDATGVVIAGRANQTATVILADTRRLDTSTRVALTDAITDIAATQDGRFAVALHEATDRVSFIDLRKLANTPEATDLVTSATTIDAPGALSVGFDRAAVLSRKRNANCQGTPSTQQSQLSTIDLASRTSSPALTLTFQGSDIELEEATNPRIFIADPCGGSVWTTTGEGPVTSFLSLAGAAALATSKHRLYVAGGTTTVPAAALISIVDLATPSATPTMITLRMPDERINLVSSTTNPMEGQAIEIRVSPDRIEVLGLAISPDGGHALMLLHSVHRQDAIPQVAPTASTIDAYYLLQVDLATGAAISRIRTDCSVQLDGDPRIFVCGPALDSEEPAEDYTPTDVALLWGAS